MVGPIKKDTTNLMKEIDETPLFMRSSPASIEGNDTLEALQALLYDGTPEGI